MHERCITEDEVEHAIANGTVIESYPNDTPYHSVLLLGHAGTKGSLYKFKIVSETRREENFSAPHMFDM